MSARVSRFLDIEDDVSEESSEVGEESSGEEEVSGSSPLTILSGPLPLTNVLRTYQPGARKHSSQLLIRERLYRRRGKF